MQDVYVNTDPGSATATAVITTEAIKDVLPTKISESMTLHLGVDSYHEAGGVLDLTGIEFTPGTELVIQTAGWNETMYQSGTDPYGGSDFKPGSAPMAIIDPVAVSTGAIVRLQGVHVIASAPVYTLAPRDAVVQVDDYGDLTMRYCTVVGNGQTGISVERGRASIENAKIGQCETGVVALGSAHVEFHGECEIAECYRCGLYAAGGALVMVMPSFIGDFGQTLTIYTTEPRGKYAAVRAIAHSTICLGVDYPGLSVPLVGFLKILRIHPYDHDHYLGVVLDSHAVLMAARNVIFGKSKDPDDEPTIPPARQFVVATSEGATAVE